MWSRGVVPIPRPSTETSPHGFTATWSCPGSAATVDGGTVAAGGAAAAETGGNVAAIVAGAFTPAVGRGGTPKPFTGRAGGTGAGAGGSGEGTGGGEAATPAGPARAP